MSYRANSLQVTQDILPNLQQDSFVHEAEQGDMTVLGLADKLGDDPDVLQASLGIRNAHDTVQVINEAKTTGMVVTVLRPRHGVEVKVDSNPILSCPLDRFEEVSAKKG